MTGIDPLRLLAQHTNSRSLSYLCLWLSGSNIGYRIYGFAKRQRELAKKQKKEEKRLRKQAEDSVLVAEGTPLPATDQPQTDTSRR